MAWIDAFKPTEAAAREKVMKATWGHLAPHRNAKYRGWFTFALGAFDSGYLNPTVLDWKLASSSCGELEASPWFAEHLCEWLQDRARTWEVGNVYRFEGYWKNYVFHGNVRCVYASGA